MLNFLIFLYLWAFKFHVQPSWVWNFLLPRGLISYVRKWYHKTGFSSKNNVLHGEIKRMIALKMQQATVYSWVWVEIVRSTIFCEVNCDVDWFSPLITLQHRGVIHFGWLRRNHFNCDVDFSLIEWACSANLLGQTRTIPRYSDIFYLSHQLIKNIPV